MSVEFKKFINNDKFSDDTAHRAILNAAIKFQAQAVEFTPVNTGRLQQSINRVQDKGDYLVGTNVEYAPHVEFGTKHQKPQSFLRASAYLMDNEDANLDDLKSFLAGIGSR